jgi:hypothetical protein
MTLRLLLSLLGSVALVLVTQAQTGAGRLTTGQGSSSAGAETDARQTTLVAQQRPMQPQDHGADRSQPKATGGVKDGPGGHGGADHSQAMPARAALKPPEGASVKILAPRPKQVVAGDGVLLKYSLVKGRRGHHVHVYVDGKLVGMFKRDPGTSRGEGTLPRLEPGPRTVELRVVADDHETELDATATVTFTVK